MGTIDTASAAFHDASVHPHACGDDVSASSLESSIPLKEFDVIGFSLQSELCYTNILNILDLSHIPLRSQDRDETYPLIIAGGPCCFNPEPIASFFDAIVIGEAEEAIIEIADCIIKWKRK